MNKSPYDEALRQLLDSNAQLDVEGKGTTNHCPMALCALAGMGAGPERLQAFFDMWVRRFGLPAPEITMRVDAQNWTEMTGNAAAFGALRAYFAHWIVRSGANAVVAQVLGRVPFAPASGAFHALIRLGYGLEAEHSGEIAAGLAALVSRNLPINMQSVERRRAASVHEGWAALSNALNGAVFSDDLISSRLRAVASEPLFGAHLLAPPEHAGLLDEMAHAALALYWKTNSFTVMHMVTGLFATRQVFAHIPGTLAQRLLPDVWAALCAAYVSIGAPPVAADELALPVDPVAAGEQVAWPELLQLAIASDDDHVIKMTFTCWREYQRQPSSLYLLAAKRVIKS
ncbi:questin oxidase family protein [Paraherbaspirillum soli]|uniref:Questin oxidase family protein n=1 Tax=Paraherbaspirillum soli TaxID=631222 RepID=A0ABW0M9S9_9BURK